MWGLTTEQRYAFDEMKIPNDQCEHCPHWPEGEHCCFCDERLVVDEPAEQEDEMEVC